MSTTSPAPAPRDRFVAFAFAGADLLVETGGDGTIAFAAGAFTVRLGQPAEHFVGRKITDLVAPVDQMPLSLALSAVAARGRIVPMVLRLNDAARTPVNVSAIFVPGTPPRLSFAFGPVPVAAPDTAPALPSARNFTREIESRIRLIGSGALSLVEVTGWQAAREAMSAADQRALRDDIQSALAASTPGGLAGEIADGRFGLLGPGGADLAGIVKRLETLLKATPAARHAKIDGATLPLSAPNVSPSQAVRALRYAVSQFAGGGAGTARAAGSDGGLEGMIAQAEQRAHGLRTVIAERRFRLNFQPVVALDGRAVHHYEALLRPLPSQGAPAQTTQDFVIFAEAVGLTEDLDCAVTDMALTALRASPSASVAVNVSGLSMQSAAFLQRFTAMLAEAGARAANGRLLVELTETAEIDDMAAAAANIASLRKIGVPVCLDDFGVGAAAFSYLREFGIDFVKIDGLYVQRATIGPRERSFVASMVELATSSGAEVVAEMIETEEQARLMRSLGAQYGQGWLFGRPGLLPGMQH